MDSESDSSDEEGRYDELNAIESLSEVLSNNIPQQDILGKRLAPNSLCSLNGNSKPALVAPKASPMVLNPHTPMVKTCRDDSQGESLILGQQHLPDDTPLSK